MSLDIHTYVYYYKRPKVFLCDVRRSYKHTKLIIQQSKMQNMPNITKITCVDKYAPRIHVKRTNEAQNAKQNIV